MFHGTTRTKYAHCEMRFFADPECKYTYTSRSPEAGPSGTLDFSFGAPGTGRCSGLRKYQNWRGKGGSYDHFAIVHSCTDDTVLLAYDDATCSEVGNCAGDYRGAYDCAGHEYPNRQCIQSPFRTREVDETYYVRLNCDCAAINALDNPMGVEQRKMYERAGRVLAKVDTAVRAHHCSMSAEDHSAEVAG